jgi:hypothetical protein
MFYDSVRFNWFWQNSCRDQRKGPYSQKSRLRQKILRRSIWAIQMWMFDHETIVWTLERNSKQKLPHLGLQNVNLL